MNISEMRIQNAQELKLKDFQRSSDEVAARDRSNKYRK